MASLVITHLKIGVYEWAQKDSNLRPMDYESTALTAELRALLYLMFYKKINSIVYGLLLYFIQQPKILI